MSCSIDKHLDLLSSSSMFGQCNSNAVQSISLSNLILPVCKILLSDGIFLLQCSSPIHRLLCN